MALQLSDRQAEAVLGKDSATRHRYFVKKTAEWQQLWGAKKGDDWLVPQSTDNAHYFPLWPHPKCAERTLTAHFPGYEAKEISLLALIDYWLPLFGQNRVKAAVFPNENWDYTRVEPEALSQQLRRELARFGRP